MPSKETAFIQDTLTIMAGLVRERYARRDAVAVTSKKSPTDLLTETDVEVQQKTLARVREAFPGDLFIGEEEGHDEAPRDTSRRCWIMDPIDGTQNFVRGLYPAFGVALAFAEGNRILAGGVALPMTNDLLLAERGGGAYLNGKPLSASPVDSMALARVEIDFSAPSLRADTLAQANRVLREAGAIRCHCAAVVGMCSVATGDMDAFVHVALNPWDFAAAQIIVEEAGGRATRLDGAPLTPFDPQQSVLATNGHLHDELLAAIPGA